MISMQFNTSWQNLLELKKYYYISNKNICWVRIEEAKNLKFGFLPTNKLPINKNTFRLLGDKAHHHIGLTLTGTYFLSEVSTPHQGLQRFIADGVSSRDTVYLFQNVCSQSVTKTVPCSS